MASLSHATPKGRPGYPQLSTPAVLAPPRQLPGVLQRGMRRDRLIAQRHDRHHHQSRRSSSLV
jgi:hypothetical protein